MTKKSIAMGFPLLPAFLCGMLLLGMLFGVPAELRAEDDVGEEELQDEEPAEEVVSEESWKRRRQQILDEMEKHIKDVVDRKFTLDRTARSIVYLIMNNINHRDLGDFRQLKGTSWNGPIKPCPRKIDKITEDINKQIDKMVMLEYPQERKKRFAQEAEEKYRMYKLREKVVVMRRGGYGSNTRVSGIYNGRNAERIQVGQAFIARLDLTPDDEARFYEDANVKLVDTYRRSQEEIFDAKAQGYRESLRIKLLPPAYLKGDYVPIPNKAGSSIKTSKAEFWMEKRTLLVKVQDYLKSEASRRLRAVETPRRMAAAKFILAKNREDKEEWMPQTVADQILKEKQREAAGAEGKEGAPQGPGPRPGGAPGPGPAGPPR